MSKNRKSKYVRVKVSYLVVAAVALVVVIGGAIGLMNSGIMDATLNNSSTAGINDLIAPSAYRSQFAGTDHVLLDVRTPEEFAEGHLDGAVNIPVQELQQRIAEVPSDQPVVVYCRSGNRSSSAARMLANAGYSEVYDIEGGIIAWDAG